MRTSHQTTHPSGNKVPEHLSTAKRASTREEKIDQQMEDSFPASDPPSYSGGNHIIGAPPARESETPAAGDMKETEKKARKGEAKKPGS
jgi:hypothetical protein